ncbi:unnamed protein product [Heterobilharzia americana]|nr:unnamed protein product [Heterobilharzia americana]
MADSENSENKDSNGKSVCELPSSLCKKAMDRPHGGIALFGPGNELMGEMKNRLKLRMTRDSESKKDPRSSTYDDVEQSETKNVSDILMNRARWFSGVFQLQQLIWFAILNLQHWLVIFIIELRELETVLVSNPYEGAGREL